MATHSSILPWKIPWAEWPGALQSMGSQRVGHDRACSHVIRIQLMNKGGGDQQCVGGNLPESCESGVPIFYHI